jgi:hypothetical protein
MNPRLDPPEVPDFKAPILPQVKGIESRYNDAVRKLKKEFRERSFKVEREWRHELYPMKQLASFHLAIARGDNEAMSEVLTDYYNDPKVKAIETKFKGIERRMDTELQRRLKELADVRDAEKKKAGEMLTK